MEYLSSRELELWNPIFALAMFFDDHVKPKSMLSLNMFTSSLNSLNSLMIGLAIDCARKRSIENVTESGEMLLVSVLRKNVTRDDYYSVKNLRISMETLYDDPQKWLTMKWVGNALRRLGFEEKRRLGTGYQYKLNKADVGDLAQRMGVEEEFKKSQEKKLRIVFETIESLENEHIDNIAKIDKVVEIAKKNEIPEPDAYEIIDQEKQRGRIYEPKPGWIKRIVH